jgi:hypothetical protein
VRINSRSNSVRPPIEINCRKLRGRGGAEYAARERRDCCLCSKSRNQVQEQIQITAIGKPAAKALTIVKVNAKRR